MRPSTTFDDSPHEGALNLSGNGQYLTLAGYQQAPGTTARATDGTSTDVIAAVSNGSGSINLTTTTLTVTPQFVRAAYSLDGNEFWVASKTPSGGLTYISGTGPASTQTPLETTTDWRDVAVINGQLFGGTGSSSVGNHDFYAISTTSTPSAPSAPTSGTPSNIQLSNNGLSCTVFSMVTLPAGTSQAITGGAASATNPNTVYEVGDPSGDNYIAKLYLPSTNTALTTSDLASASNESLVSWAGGTPEAVLAQIDPNNSTWVDLYITTASGVYFGVDESGSASGDMGNIAFTQIIAPTSDQAFYGLAAAPVPEPASLGLLSLGALVLLRRRRAV